jgi:hypothetical protein
MRTIIRRSEVGFRQLFGVRLDSRIFVPILIFLGADPVQSVISAYEIPRYYRFVWTRFLDRLVKKGKCLLRALLVPSGQLNPCKLKIPPDGYLRDSGDPNSLWF